ncbi:hypothetical protein ACLMJK_001722 [Lecanora helva]
MASKIIDHYKAHQERRGHERERRALVKALPKYEAAHGRLFCHDVKRAERGEGRWVIEDHPKGERLVKEPGNEKFQIEKYGRVTDIIKKVDYVEVRRRSDFRIIAPLAKGVQIGDWVRWPEGLTPDGRRE